MTNSTIDEKVAVVTGAGGTLCSVIAKDLAEQGARVALLGRTQEKLDRVAEEIRAAGGVALPLTTDVTDEAAVEEARAAVASELGECSILINGAGGNRSDAVTTTTKFDPEEIADSKAEELRGFFNLEPGVLQEIINLNTLGTIIPSQVFGRGMARLGRGVIVNFASMNTYRPLTKNLAYSLAKAGVANLTQWMAVYLAPAGIRVNAVAPGFFANERSRKILMDGQGGFTARGQQVIDHTPMARFGHGTAGMRQLADRR